TYSDRPIPGGTPVEIQPAQTYSAPQSPLATGSRGAREERELADALDFRYTGCSLSPRNDENFTNPSEVLISLALNPALRAGDNGKISVDGNAMTSDGGSMSVTIPQPDRGSHTVSALVTDRSGKSLCVANTTFHVQRPSLNSPTRVPPRPPPKPN